MKVKPKKKRRRCICPRINGDRIAPVQGVGMYCPIHNPTGDKQHLLDDIE
jgi:hypothetical protein